MNHLHFRTYNLSKRFGSNRVFDDINFRYAQGVLGIAGPNGSGKSTLLQCLAGLIRPSSGRVEWYKKEQNINIQKLKNRLGYAAPYINLYEELSCRENLDFLMQLRKQANPSQKIEAALEQAQITHLADQLFAKLSTGQQQRLRLAAAIVHQPDVLFLDEPGSNLDESGRTLIQSLVSEFKEAGKMIIIASNNPEELELCDAVYSVEGEAFR